MIRKDKDVKGFEINNKEFMLSQYADDTQMFLDGTEPSLKNALVILRKFYLMSGLNINLDKTKVLWIGTISQIKSYVENLIRLGTKTLKILGVIFTPEVFNIWDYNSDIIMKKLMV